jgi:hypothetical protein
MKPLCALLLFCISIINCGNQSSKYTDSWQFIGNYIVSIDSLSMSSDTITNDTLIAKIYSSDIWKLKNPGDRFDNDTIIVERAENKITLSLKADVYKFTGTGYMPPTPLVPRGGEICLIPLQNKKGGIQIYLAQSDGTFKADTIYAK